LRRVLLWSPEPARCVVARHPAVAPSTARQRVSNSLIDCVTNGKPAWIRSSFASNSSASGCSWRTRAYQCPRCDERYLGERRCASCQLYCRALGQGGQCEDCDHIMLLTELLGT